VWLALLEAGFFVFSTTRCFNSLVKIRRIFNSRTGTLLLHKKNKEAYLMKKIWSLAFVLVLLMSAQTVSANKMDKTPAMDNESRMMDTNKLDISTDRSTLNDVNNYNNSIHSNGLRPNDITDNNTDRYRANATNFRANAVDNNDRDMNWSWLGLLGLAGLFGLRSRQREES